MNRSNSPLKTKDIPIKITKTTYWVMYESNFNAPLFFLNQNRLTNMNRTIYTRMEKGPIKIDPKRVMESRKRI